MTVSKYQVEAERIKIEFDAYKRNIPVIMQECIDEYQLDLCEDGVADFCKRIGVDPPSTTDEASVSIYITGFELKSRKGTYGREFDDDAVDKLVSDIQQALKPIKDKYDTRYIEVDSVEMV